MSLRDDSASEQVPQLLPRGRRLRRGRRRFLLFSFRVVLLVEGLLLQLVPVMFLSSRVGAVAAPGAAEGKLLALGFVAG